MIIIANPTQYKEKEDLYVNVRTAEGRIPDDRSLKLLPDVTDSSSHINEWPMRKQSFARFTDYLKRKFGGRTLNILDVGCGNGWMCHRLSEKGHRVTGVDLNLAELEQAERVFGSNSQLQWVYADIMEDAIPGAPFDIVLFSASCQYFSNLSELTDEVKGLLSNSGEIHLLDSVFYKTSQLYEAKARSIDYYSRLGYPAMAAYYFHHTTDELKRCGYKKLYPGLFSFHSPLQWWMCSKH
ncbi:MAG: class SAM-dependent methyltransferase [Flavipsychrobacter sp.]|jgi:ubiquinone/menaquinone biosynthesis C-methylase UbiE|nr:class SAM-dependent methyltransferase [Flavipsychrobacter sp.]